jgi:hypothetical protein
MEDKIEMELIPTSELKIRCKRVSAHFNTKGGITATVSDPDMDELIKDIGAVQIYNVHKHFLYQLLDLIGKEKCIEYFNITGNE